MLRRVLGLLLVTAVVASCGGGTETSQGRTRNLSATCFSTSQERDDTLKVLTFSVSSLTEQLSAMRPLGELQQVADLAAKNLEVASSELAARQVAFATKMQATDTLSATSAELIELNRLFIAKEQQVQIVVSMQDLKNAADEALDTARRAETQYQEQVNRLQYAQATPLCAVPEDATASTLDEGTTTSAAESGGDASVTTLGDTSTTVADGTTTSVAESGGDTSVTTLGDGDTTFTDVTTTSATQSAGASEASDNPCLTESPKLPPAQIEVGVEFFVGFPGCTHGIQQTSGVGATIEFDGRFRIIRFLPEFEGISGTYWQMSATETGPSQTFNLVVGRFGEVPAILLKRYDGVVSVRQSSKSKAPCSGYTPQGEFDDGKVSVASSCSDATGISLDYYAKGSPVRTTDRVFGITRREDNVRFLFYAYPKITIVATHLCGDDLAACGDELQLVSVQLPAPKASSASVNPCLDPANPKYNCGWAVVDTSGSVTSVIVCNFEVCGTGSFGGFDVVLQTRLSQSGTVVGWAQGKYEKSTNRFYPDGIPGRWFTGGDEVESIYASLESSSIPESSSTTVLPTASSTTVAPATTAMPSNAVTVTTQDVVSSTTSTTVTPATTSTTVVVAVAPAADTRLEPTVVITPLPASALQREDESAGATNDESVSDVGTQLPIPVPDRATAMICDAQCVSDARSQAEADDDATVEIEVADGLWIPAENAIVPVAPDGTSLRFRVTPTTGSAVVLGGQVASASAVLERASEGLVTASSDGTIKDSMGNIVDIVPSVGSVETQQSGFSTVLAIILALLALITALFIAFLVKFFLKGRKSVAPTGDQVDQDGRT